MNDLPSLGQSAPASSRPAGSPAGGGWIEPKIIALTLAKVNTSGTQRLTAAVAARIYNPAARLVCAVSLSFEPRTPQAFSNFSSSVWTGQAMRPGTGEGRDAQLHAIWTSQTLPQLYEVSTSVRGILVSATLAIPLTAGAAAIEGEWVLRTEWEPAMPMCADEIAGLYARCAATQTLFAAGPLAP